MNQHMVQNVAFLPETPQDNALFMGIELYEETNPEADSISMDTHPSVAWLELSTDHEEVFLGSDYWHEDWESSMLITDQVPDGPFLVEQAPSYWENLRLGKGPSNPWHDQCLNWVNQLTCMTSLHQIELLIESIEHQADGKALDLVYYAYNTRIAHLQIREHANMLHREVSKRVFVVVEKVQYPLIMRKAGAKVLAFDPKKAKEYELAGYRA